MKKILIFGLIVLLVIGHHMFKKETLTKEQQEQIITNIAKNYDIESIKFISFKKMTKQGVLFEIMMAVTDNEHKRLMRS